MLFIQVSYNRILILDDFKSDDFKSDDELYEMPLSVTKVRKLNPLDALRQFINDVSLAYMPDMDLVISREKSMIAQLLKKYKNPSFNICCPLNVQFMSAGVFKMGIDAGGPKREFFHLLINELVRGNFNGMQIFEGETGHLLPINNYELISSHFYKMVGRMILHAIINKCEGIPGISPAVISYVVSGSRDSVLGCLSIQDIPDPCLCEKLNEVIINVIFSGTVIPEPNYHAGYVTNR